MTDPTGSAASSAAAQPDVAAHSSDGSPEHAAERMAHFQQGMQQLLEQVQRSIVGHDDLITDCLVAMLSGGHALLEGVPGLGKTYLVRVLSQVMGLSFGRVQCTPDLMPADILGTHIVSEDQAGHRMFRFEKGPVFKHLLLVDEINRATPKSQSALLEVMQERAVTAGGERYPLPSPFFILATQNPLEMEGTYPLPEAQLDRFLFKLRVTFPDAKQLVEIAQRTTTGDEHTLEPIMTGPQLLEMQHLLTQVPVADPVAEYAARLILATHPESDEAVPAATRLLAYGASPRGMQALIRAARAYCLLDGRTAAAVRDVRRAAYPALRHRLILSFEGQAESANVDQLITELIEHVSAPGSEAA